MVVLEQQYIQNSQNLAPPTTGRMLSDTGNKWPLNNTEIGRTSSMKYEYCLEESVEEDTSEWYSKVVNSQQPDATDHIWPSSKNSKFAKTPAIEG